MLADDICPMGSFCTTQQNFLIACSEPCLGMDPEDEHMKDTVPALLGLTVSDGVGAHNPNGL